MSTAELSLLGAAFLAAQQVLFVSIWRKPHDDLSPTVKCLRVNAVKGLSFAIFLLPLTFWDVFTLSALDSIAVLTLCGAACFTTIGDWLVARAFQLNKVGVVATIFEGLIALTTFGIGITLFHESWSWQHGAGAALLIICMVLIDGVETNADRATLRSAARFAAAAGLFCGVGNALFGAGVQAMGFWAATLLWQAGVGILSGVVLIVGLRAVMLRGRIDQLAPPGFLVTVAICTIPGIAGVLLFGKAQQSGNIGLANIVVTSGVRMIMAVLSVWFLRERLSIIQWISILASCYAVWLLKG